MKAGILASKLTQDPSLEVGYIKVKGNVIDLTHYRVEVKEKNGKVLLECVPLVRDKQAPLVKSVPKTPEPEQTTPMLSTSDTVNAIRDTDETRP